MISVREALDGVLRDLPRLGAEQVPLTHARGRVLAQAVHATRDIPSFRNAAMDGYAVRAAEVAGAGRDHPVRLRVVETVAAGTVPRAAVQPGTAARIMTGAVMPEGADAVVRVEDSDGGESQVAVFAAVTAGASVRLPGEDLRAGECVLPAGRALRPADVGLLASLSRSMVAVARRPRVAIVATGDELVDVGEPLAAGQIVNSNAYTLAAAVDEAGGEAVMLGIVRDEPARLRAAFAAALDADVVLSSGGVSAGSFDYVRASLADLGYAERFWKVAQKPGKPLTFGVCAGTPVFGLPGNPVSSLVCFSLYVRPALRAMMGLAAVHLPSTTATLDERVAKSPDLTEFVRGVLDGPPDAYRVRPTGTQSSAVLRSLSLGDALIVGPPGLAVLEAGAPVRVVLLAPDTGSVTPPC